jgi:hypothetical protein
MICNKCGKEFSKKIWKIHREICTGNKAQKDDVIEEKQEIDTILSKDEEQFLRQKAKDLGISHYWNKSIENLNIEIAEIEGD